VRPGYALAGLLALALGAAAGAARAQEGKAVYEQQCAACHASGLAGAPRRGSVPDWSGRLKSGRAALYRSAIEGTPRGMPARGGNATLSDAAVRGAVDYLLGGSAPRPAAAAPAATPVAAPAAAVASPVVAAVAPAPAATTPEPGSGSADSNAFNRLLKAPGARNLPPLRDGIHDPGADGTPQLQEPMSSFGALPRANAGNRVDWVKALEQRRIAPRWEKESASTATVMDLNIVREVKGSMPDVVYPHKQHTEWLDCSNCHPAIFVPQKGANQMSMAAILLGQGCGTCHGKVAFPVSECRLCHSRKKEGVPAAAQTAQGTVGK
jgi:c(7)-type cytochrome triheme protein